MIRQSFDTQSQALYLQVSDAPVESTVEVTPSAFMDLDADGAPVGLELLGVSGRGMLVTDVSLLEALKPFRLPDDLLRLLSVTTSETQTSPEVMTSAHS